MRKGIFAKIAAVGIAAALSVVALAGCGGSSEEGGDTVYRTLEQIQEDGTIRIGVFSDKNPFGFVDENGEYQGYDIALAERMAEDMGVEIEYVSTEPANRVEYLETGKVDVILANFTVTDERAQVVDFCNPYMNVSIGVASPEDAQVKDLADLGEDDAVIVITGTTAETYMIENYPDVPLKKFETYASAKSAFENKEGVCWANDNTEVMAFCSQVDGFVVSIPELGGVDTIAPAVSKGNTSLLDWINQEMAALGSEMFFHAAYEDTLMDTYGPDYMETLVVEGVPAE